MVTLLGALGRLQELNAHFDVDVLVNGVCVGKRLRSERRLLPAPSFTRCRRRATPPGRRWRAGDQRRQRHNVLVGGEQLLRGRPEATQQGPLALNLTRDYYVLEPTANTVPHHTTGSR